MTIATPHDSNELWKSTGRATSMFFDQWNFPLEFEDDEEFTSRDDDRLDYSHFQQCKTAHGWRSGEGMDSFLRKLRGKKCLEFIIDVLAPNNIDSKKKFKAIRWTGYRIMTSIHKGNGNTVWHLQLFAKKPNSSTMVYSDDEAPNVLPKPQPRSRNILPGQYYR